MEDAGASALRRRLRSRGSARGVDAFAQFGAGAGVVHQAAGDDVAFVVFGKVFVDAGGDELLHAEPHLAFLEVDGEHLRLDDLADAQHVGGELMRFSAVMSLTWTMPSMPSESCTKAPNFVRFVTGPSIAEPT